MNQASLSRWMPQERQSLTTNTQTHRDEAARPESSATEPNLFSANGRAAYQLTLFEAGEFAARVILNLPRGTTFTSKKLFEGVALKNCDKRGFGRVLRSCADAGFIERVGFTHQDQGDRHSGVAALWRVV